MEQTKTWKGNTSQAIKDMGQLLPFVHLLDMGTLFLPGTTADGWKGAVIDGRLVGAFSDRYQPVQHKTPFMVAARKLQEMGYGDVPVTVKLTEHGARMYATFYLPVWVTDDKTGRDLQMTLKVFNSADGSMPVSVSLGTYRLICKNGASIGRIVAKLSKKHHKGKLTDVEGQIKTMIETVVVKMEEYIPLLANMVSVAKNTVVHDIESAFVQLGFGKRTVKRLIELAQEDEGDARYSLGEKTTAWAVYNAITRLATQLETGQRKTTDRESVNQAEEYRAKADHYLESLVKA